MDLYAAEVARYRVPDRAAAAMWNAAVKCLQDNGFTEKAVISVTLNEKTITEKLTVDRYKIRRSKEKLAKKQKEKKNKETKGGTNEKHDKKTMKKETVTINNVETVQHFVGTDEFTHMNQRGNT